MEGLFDYSLWGLFLASFLAATVVPFSSEALLSFLIVNGTDAYTAVMVATAGNWLGGMSSFCIPLLGTRRGRYFCCRAWSFTCQYPDHCHFNVCGKIFTLCDMGMADRAGILIQKPGYFFRKERIFQKM